MHKTPALHDFQNYLVNEENLGVGTAKSYAVSYANGLFKHFGESLESIFEKALLYSENGEIDSATLAAVAYLDGRYQRETPAIRIKTFSNYKSAVKAYFRYHWIYRTKKTSLPQGLVPFTSNTLSKTISQKDLADAHESRLRTQDRAYAFGFIFPNRFFCPKYLGTEDFKSYFILPQLKKAKAYVSPDGKECVLLSSIQSIKLQEIKTGENLVIAVLKDREVLIYSQTSSGSFEQLVVKDVSEISLDHQNPLKEIFQRLFTDKKLTGAAFVSKKFQEVLKSRGLKKIPENKVRTEIFATVHQLGIITDAVRQQLAAEFALISEEVQLVLMHKRHNSSKGARKGKG